MAAIDGFKSLVDIGAIEALHAATKLQIYTIFFGFHVWFGYALDALVALHVLRALKHQLWDGEAELQRMLP